MSAPMGGPEVNKFEQVSSDGQHMSLSGGPYTVRSHVLGWGPGGSLYSEVPCPGVGAQEGPCTVKSHVLGWGPGGSLYSEIPFLGMGSLYSEVPCMVVGPEPAGSLYIKVQYSMGNGHTAAAPRTEDRQTPVKTSPSCNFVGRPSLGQNGAKREVGELELCPKPHP